MRKKIKDQLIFLKKTLSRKSYYIHFSFENEKEKNYTIHSISIGKIKDVKLDSDKYYDHLKFVPVNGFEMNNNGFKVTWERKFGGMLKPSPFVISIKNRENCALKYLLNKAAASNYKADYGVFTKMMYEHKSRYAYGWDVVLIFKKKEVFLKELNKIILKKYSPKIPKMII